MAFASMISTRPPARRTPVAGGEAALRSSLIEFLADQRGAATRLIQEFWIPPNQERADVVWVNGSMAGYEIKSSRDRLDRLPRQIGAYGAVFDKCFVVADDKHLAKASDLVPNWWGVLRFSSVHGLEIVSAGRHNPSIDPNALIQLLWRSELESALAGRIGKTDPGLSRAALRRDLLACCDTAGLRDVVRSALLARDPQARRFSAARPSGGRC